MLMAHLLHERSEAEDDEGEDASAEGGDQDHRLLKALVGSGLLRRRRARRMLMAHLRREEA